MEDDNDIFVGDYIVKAISFNGCISYTNDVLVDVANLFGKIAFKKSKTELENRKHMNYVGGKIR